MIFTAAVMAAAASSARPVFAHHPLAGAGAAIQTQFDRGLTLYYSYNGAEGVHVFRALEQAEPSLAMAYWGEALALGSDINVPVEQPRFVQAHAAIEKAAALETTAAPADRALIDAMRLRYAGDWNDREKAESAYRDAMVRAANAFPQDDDLGALAVEALFEAHRGTLWKPDSSLPQTNDTATMVALLDRIIAHNPNHLMANHLIIHIFEQSTDRSRAVLAAARLDAMAFTPENEHLAHMTAHTWVDTGAYAKAVQASARALALFDTYKTTPGADPFHTGYYGHDASVGWHAALMLGNYATALRFAKALDAVRKTKPAASAELITQLRFGRPFTIPQLAKPSPTDATHLLAAYAALGHNDVATARTELAGWPEKTTDPVALALLGAVALAQGDAATAQTRFDAAAAAEKEAFRGETLPEFPSGEIVAAARYRAGDFAGAQDAYRATLARYPNDARALLGLSKTLAKLGKLDDAQAARQAFARVWSGSDTAPEAALPL